MSERINKYGTDYHGESILEGWYGVSPSGQVVMCPARMPLKPGWRYATAEEVEHGPARSEEPEQFDSFEDEAPPAETGEESDDGS